MESAMALAKKTKMLGSGKSLGSKCLAGDSKQQPFTATPMGYLPVYVGEERQRFVIPTAFLSHPLFKILLEKAYMEYGFQQRNGLTLPCSVSVFQEVVTAVKCFRGQFNLEKLVEEFVR